MEKEKRRSIFRLMQLAAFKRGRWRQGLGHLGGGVKFTMLKAAKIPINHCSPLYYTLPLHSSLKIKVMEDEAQSTIAKGRNRLSFKYITLQGQNC